MKPQKTLFALYGAIIFSTGVLFFLIGSALGLLQAILSNHLLSEIVNIIVWYSGLPVVLGSFLISIDIFFSVRKSRKAKYIKNDPINTPKIVVALTAYNDEASIAQAITDFKTQPNISEIIVISNNSTDNTLLYAQQAGATAFNETKQGYGACVYRALEEATKITDANLVLLCEGDMTFRAYDIPKFLAYIPHADIVNGTRIVEQLQDSHTQISTFIHYGNLAVAKLLEIKYLTAATLTDVGTTYKMIRKDTLKELLPHLDSDINLEFNPHFLEQAIKNGYSLVECPVTFHRRVGISKGGNASNLAAVKCGLKMILGIISKWNYIK